MVSLLASSSLVSSEEALDDAETILQRVSAMTSKIKQELRSKAHELQSFAPEELGNIPRKCKFVLIKYMSRYQSNFHD